MITSSTGINGQPYNDVVEITPSMAERWLEANQGNRRLDWSFVSRLSRDMKNGRFPCTHQGIAFDANGRLIDGQHRLWALLDANVPVRMRVFRNEPPGNAVHVDGINPRTAADRITLDRSLGTVHTDDLATLRAMLSGITMRAKKRTVSEEIELLRRHQGAIRFAHNNLPKQTRGRGLVNAATRAVIARAWYCVPEVRLLRRFCEVLRSGIGANEKERPILLLRTQLTDSRMQRPTQAIRQKRYALTSRALAAYVDEKPVTLLRASSCELFLLPHEIYPELETRS